MSDTGQTISILFPMEKVFEDYVGWLLGRTGGVSALRLQASSKWLMQEPKKFQMKPDFYFSWDKAKVIGDTKWKLIDPKASDGKCDVSQGDLYQLYAYGKKYGVKTLVLFYPATDKFKSSISWRFDEYLNLELVPVPLPGVILDGWKERFHSILSEALDARDTR